MWDYRLIFPSFIILVVFLGYYFSSPRPDIRMNRTFMLLMLVEIWVILTDLVACRADENFSMFPVWVLYVVNMLYFVLFILRIYLFGMYTQDVLEASGGKKTNRLPCCVVFALTELVILSSCFTGAVFRIDADGYHSGPLYNILYVCYLFFILYDLWLVLRSRGSIRRFTFLNLLAFNLFLLIGICIRYLMPQLLVMNSFTLIALVVIYLAFANPDLYLVGRGRIGSFNQNALEQVLHERIGKKKFRLLGFIMRDYDYYRSIYGGEQMDIGISEISRYIVNTYPSCMLFDLRSGRFVLLGDEGTDMKKIREELGRRFDLPWRAENAELFLNVSFVQMTEDVQVGSTDTLINCLNTAYEETRRSPDGSDSFIDTERIIKLDQEIEVKRALERALERNEVDVFLQPVMDAATRKMVGAEALARIWDEKGNLISPVLFIPIAEKNGQISVLGEQVFEKACRFIHEHDMEKLGLSWINVNLSPIQCMCPDLQERFFGILRRYDVRADQIHLEITEQSMADFSSIQNQIQALKKDGFHFVLDDYGSGYSNLTRVRSYPFINIKLDMEVVWDYFRTRDTLLPSMVSAFKRMHFSVTAEGVETKEMADALSEIGCDYLQGFYYARPMPIEEFVARVSALNTIEC